MKLTRRRVRARAIFIFVVESGVHTHPRQRFRLTRASTTMPSVVSRVSEYAPGWLADYATVASALRDNYSALGPFEMSDVMIGITSLREEERRKRSWMRQYVCD